MLCDFWGAVYLSGKGIKRVFGCLIFGENDKAFFEKKVKRETNLTKKMGGILVWKCGVFFGTAGWDRVGWCFWEFGMFAFVMLCCAVYQYPLALSLLFLYTF